MSVPETLFIADLHLSAVQPRRVALFQRFLAERAARAESLYILGDLFDAYLGDDDRGFPAGAVQQALRRLVDSGTRVYFQHGNRDFLIGDVFADRTGVSLLNEYTVVERYGDRILLTHGDLLCTDDVHYQEARRRVRSAQWKQAALRKPLLARKLYARWYRLRSFFDKRGKSLEIMDVNSEEVIRVCDRFAVDTLVHGHTHRPADHRISSAGRGLRRLVLAEWKDCGEYLRWSPQGFERHRVG
jgi:UDP-2,3-diacylglucosamine hydrolase